jgi:MFS transporter, ACS family, solute carrier family 17 (sodium-dependent inorganic phosphate cotransporter), member 5
MLEIAVYFGILVSAPLTGLFVVSTGSSRSFLIAGFLLSSIATLSFPFLCRTLFLMMWAQALAGLGQGMVFVAMHHFLLLWVPRQEYTRAITFLYSSMYAGQLISGLWAAVLSSVYSWQASFYWFGVLSLLFLALWAYVVVPSPSSHPKITSTELAFLRANSIPFEPSRMC